MREASWWLRPQSTTTAWTTTRWSSPLSLKMRQVIGKARKKLHETELLTCKCPLFPTAHTPPTPRPGGPRPRPARSPCRGWARGRGRPTPRTPPTSSQRQRQQASTPRATPRSWGPRCLTTRGGDTDAGPPDMRDLVTICTSNNQLLYLHTLYEYSSEIAKYISDIQSAQLTRFSFDKKGRYARMAQLPWIIPSDSGLGPRTRAAKMQEMHQKLGIAQTSILRVQFESSGLLGPGLSMVVMQRSI